MGSGEDRNGRTGPPPAGCAKTAQRRSSCGRGAKRDVVGDLLSSPPGEREGAGWCHPNTELTRGTLVDFVSITDNPNVERRGLDAAGAEAARVLARPGAAVACSEFDRILAPVSSVTWSDGSPTYQIAYYVHGGHYYMVRALSQPEASGTVASGLSFVYVFDAGLEHVGGRCLSPPRRRQYSRFRLSR